MPILDGFQALEQLKQDEVTSHIPVIMLSATGQKGHVLKSYQLGAVDYLTKPFKPNELAARVKRILLEAREVGCKPS